MNRFHSTEIKEPVKVGAVFENASVKPKWFIWNSKKHSLEKITYTWTDKDKGQKVICFSVWDGTDIYELSFNVKFCTWRLEKVYYE
ncbi:MAG: hypothetical protein ABIH89_00735 [Elusimicrobiota bacterium]